MKEDGNNRGIIIDSMNANVGSPKGASWCAAFVYWCLDKAGIKYLLKKSGMARSLVNKNSFSAFDVIMHRKNVKAGMLVVWQKGKTPYGHTGFVRNDWNGISGNTLEGNTSSGIAGSQSDGDGVYPRKRRIEPFNYFRIKWFTPI